MATYNFLLWSIGDLSTTGPDPFNDDSNANTSAPGNSTITIGGAPSVVSLVDDDTNFGDGDNSQTVNGKQTDTEYSYIVRPAGSNDPADNVKVFVVYEGSTLLGVTSDGPLHQGTTYNIVAVHSSGPSVAYSSLYVCYAPGSLIGTPDGLRAVETLQEGDLVETLDHGPMPIRWVRTRTHSLKDAGADDAPILIRAGAFGPGCPSRDLVVSPQHRILVGGCGQLDGLFEGQCFAPAKALTGLPRIRSMPGKKSITWVHFALDSHEVVSADGCYSESLLLGPMVLNGLPTLQREHLTRQFGAPADPEAALNGPPARDCLKVGVVRRIIRDMSRTGAAAGLAA